ncbi:MAG: RNA-binding protein [Myxococcales bacterium]|nr:RNA-binding protein [Myxococcales bacterium]
MTKRLYVGGLSLDTTEHSLESAFAAHGELAEVKIVQHRETGRSRGFGFITYVNPDDAQSAILAMDGTNLDGRTIKVNDATERPGRGQGGSRRQW